MPSLVETSIVANGFIAGQISVQTVSAQPGPTPRLSIRLGVSLNDDPNHGFGKDRPAVSFNLINILGELRLEEHSKPLALSHWINRSTAPYSVPRPHAHQVELACDLDCGKLERLEDARLGGDATFWLALWPSLADAQGHIDARSDALRVDVPQNKWLAILDTLRGGVTHVVEIPGHAMPSDIFGNALAQLADAKRRVDTGDFDEAIGACRRALEGTVACLNLRLRAEDLEAALAKVIDEERASKFATIITRLKELGNSSIHRSEVSTGYLRADAQFVVACTGHTMALLARLLARQTET